eukprot:XP_011677844.1 PREDICTED: 60S ribosomal subunit assembly/export protein-like [Strongylocentrotus purpuratus]
MMEDMAALELESGIGQAAEETPETSEPAPQPAGKKKTRGGKKGKKGMDEDELMAEVAAIEAAGKGGGKKKDKEAVENHQETKVAEPDVSMETADVEPEQSRSTGKKGKKKKGKGKDWNEDELLEDMAALEEGISQSSENEVQEKTQEKEVS